MTTHTLLYQAWEKAEAESRHRDDLWADVAWWLRWLAAKYDPTISAEKALFIDSRLRVPINALLDRAYQEKILAPMLVLESGPVWSIGDPVWPPQKLTCSECHGKGYLRSKPLSIGERYPERHVMTVMCVSCNGSGTVPSNRLENSLK